MARLSIPGWFRAEGAVTNWHLIDRQQNEHGNSPPEIGAQRKRALIDRAVDVHLRWSLRAQLGLPEKPFTVWVRSRRREPKGVDVRATRVGNLTTLSLPEVAGHVVIDCAVVNPAQPVSAFGLINGLTMRSAVAADSATSPGGGRVVLRLSAFGMDKVRLVNGTDAQVAIEPVADIINAPDWKPVEIVGLPVDGSWGGSAYSHDDQGLVAAPTAPFDAAIERVQRGAPPIGWAPLTETGIFAPIWEPVDPKLMVEEVAKELMPSLDQLFQPGVAPHNQLGIIDEHMVDPPTQGGRTSSAKATAKLPPLGLLMLAGSSEPALALATGFGTAYSLEPSTIDEIRFGETDFMVTIDHDDLPFVGGAELASFVPWPASHHTTTPAADVTVGRDGLVRPELINGPWRESVRVSWRRPETTIALGRPTGSAIASFDSTTVPGSQSLLPRRAAGGWRTMLPMPDAPEGEPGHDRTSFVDGDAVLPLDGSNRAIGYAVASQDVFGIWSNWTDRVHQGSAPPPPGPRIISSTLTATYAGTNVCPSRAELEVAIDWSTRTPSSMELSLGFFPMAAVNSDPPAALGADGPTPAGTFRVTVPISFLGAAPVNPPGISVQSLDTAGENVVAPGPVLQGEDGRRYRIGVPVPTLDFSGTQRWGVRIWARSTLVALTGSTPWKPVNPPAKAVAASPVPIEPLPLPPPPGVPLGSTPDAEGRSHVKVRWALPTGATPRSITVWEVAESSLRQSLGLPKPPDGTSPGVRLSQLRSAYDGLAVDKRRRHFRRIEELAGSARETDVALPKGSRDIHLFAVTTMTDTGVESSWPTGSAEGVLRAAIAPRVVAPSPPIARSTVGAAGAVTVTIESASRVAVQEFRVHRTSSPEAARRIGSMGPPVATAVPTAGPVDAASGETTWTATWNGSFPESWKPSYVRVVAVPVADTPIEALRGSWSAPSDSIVVNVLPAGAPDLDPLVGNIWGASHDGVVVRTSTDAMAVVTDRGPHRLRVIVDGAVTTTTLDALEIHDAQPPGGGVTVVRGTRATGRTPLAIWFTRPDRTVPSEVTMHLTDPLGRTTTQSVTVPPYAPAPLDLTITDVFTIAGRGVTFLLTSNSQVDGSEPGTLAVQATTTGRTFPPAPPISASFRLGDIRRGRMRPARRTGNVQIVRTSSTVPFEFSAFIRSTKLAAFVVTITMDDGRTVSARHRFRIRPLFDPRDRFLPRNPFDPR